MIVYLKYKTSSIGKKKDYITREGVFRHMWMNTELTDNHKNKFIKSIQIQWNFNVVEENFGIFSKNEMFRYSIYLQKNIVKAS